MRAPFYWYQFAKAVASLRSDEKDTFRSRQLDRLLDIKEKELQIGPPLSE